MSYSIDAVVRLTGISAFTLRNWEARYHLIRPKRARNGFRTYTEEHVELLKKVIVLLRHGSRIGDLAKCVRQGQSLPEILEQPFEPELAHPLEQLLEALMRFDLPAAEAMHSQLCSKLDRAHILERVYAPLLHRISQLWHTEEITLAQERFSSRFLWMRVATYLADPSESIVARDRAIFTTAPGHDHESRQIILAAGLRLRGWSTYYLGAQFPLRDLRAAARRIRPRLVCISFANIQDLESSLATLVKLETEVCVSGPGALICDPGDLPSNLKVFRDTDGGAGELLARLTPPSRPKRPQSS